MYSGNQPSKSVRSQPFLRLTLTPLQLPEMSLAAEQGAWTRRYGNRQSQPTQQNNGRSLAYTGHPVIAPHLCVCPGEPSQLLVQVHNQSAQAWTFRLEVSTSIPSGWQRLPEEDFELSGQTDPEAGDDVVTEVEIPFQIPANYFENHQALKLGDNPLKINYDGQIQVYARPRGASPETAQLMATAPFKVLLRPLSRYLDYLPQVYREVDFIGRLLKLFEQSFDPSVETLKLLWAYLDPRTASMNLLPFLAHWVGWPTDFPWQQAPLIDLKRQRQLIFNAMDLYRWRGTQRGLQRYLQLYTGLPEDCIHIENGFKPGFELGAAQLDETAIIGGGRPYHFTVRLRPHPPQVSDSALAAKRSLLQTIINQERPAFCTYELHIEDPSQP